MVGRSARFKRTTLYLSHGGGGNAVDWTTQGAANSILDNLIIAGKIRPMVVVMTDFYGLGSCQTFDPTCYAPTSRRGSFRLSTTTSGCLAILGDARSPGFSLGGLMANYLLFNDTTTFGYYGGWSIGSLGAPDPSSPLWRNPALQSRLGIQLGGGIFDELTVPGINDYEATFETNGIPFTAALVTGGHEWYTWRQSLYNFVTTVAFLHPSGTP